VTRYPARLKYWTARSCFSAASRVLKVPRFLRCPDFASFFLEYNRYSPDFSFRIMPLPEQLRCQERVIIAPLSRPPADAFVRAFFGSRALLAQAELRPSGSVVAQAFLPVFRAPSSFFSRKNTGKNACATAR
jgi:hypothetical protein